MVSLVDVVAVELIAMPVVVTWEGAWNARWWWWVAVFNMYAVLGGVAVINNRRSV